MEAPIPCSENALFQQILYLASGNRFPVIFCDLLVEAIIGIRGKQFPKKQLIIASGQLIFWLVEAIFSLFFRDYH